MDREIAQRYQRQIVLPDFGPEGQEKLLKAKVLIVGAGGLGVPVLQYLNAMGVGTIGIVDGDVISLTNLQRQVLYGPTDVDLPKVEVAKRKMLVQNPTTRIETFNEMLSVDNAQTIFSKYDLIIDCTDDISARYLISDTCVDLNLPFVYGALYRHEGQVSVFNFEGSPTYRDAFPDDSVKVDNCNEIGVLGVLPGIIGTYQAMEAVKVLTGFGETLAGKLLLIDAAYTEHTVIELAPTNARDKITIDKPNWLTWEEVTSLKEEDYQWLDIRDDRTFDQAHDPRFQNVPMSQLAGFEAEQGKHILLVCQQGKSTQQAATILQGRYPFTTIFQVKGGYNAI